MSGTAEEIERHIKTGKSAMVYFSNTPVVPDGLDTKQYEDLKDFRKWCRDKGLIEIYDSYSDFQQKFTRHLAIQMNRNAHLRETLNQEPNSLEDNDHLSLTFEEASPSLAAAKRGTALSEEAKQLLVEASLDKLGIIFNSMQLSGRKIQTNKKTFGDARDRRSMARWEHALGQLVSHHLVLERGYNGEIFAITNLGFDVVKQMRAAQP